MGALVGRLLSTLAVTVQKCAVLPLSAMARESGGTIVGGGPTKTVLDRQTAEYSFKTLGWLVVSQIGMVVGSPPRQLGAVVCRWRGRPDEIVLLPPFILKAVASSLWPSALRWHVSDV